MDITNQVTGIDHECNQYTTRGLGSNEKVGRDRTKHTEEAVHTQVDENQVNHVCEVLIK